MDADKTLQSQDDDWPPPGVQAVIHSPAATMSNQLYNTSSVIFSLEEAAAGGYNDSDSPTITTELLQPSLVPVARALNPWDVVVCVAGTLVSLENAVVMALIIYTPTLRAPMFVLIASLALADLLAGLGLILNFVVIYVVVPVAGYWGLVMLLSAGVLITAFSASVLNVLAITVDRYLSLYNALTYHTERTVTFTYVTLFLIWLTSAALGSLPVLGWNCLGNEATCSICWPVNKNNAAALAVSFLLVFALILQLYLQICKIAFRHAQQIAVQHFMTTSHASSTTKGVSTLSVILGTFALCWIPFAMYSLVADSRYPTVYTYATALPAICHSFINPIIYAFRNPDIQRSLRLACCGCMPRSFTMRPRTPSDV
ncbi:G-protein coupled receptor 12 [Engraulis encrasicolus]|uniref:G-protein coupled receptor 12 n=1 Tax=Engraulis encrasicolus TaxID=184585 RepID=UPI002FCF6A06